MPREEAGAGLGQLDGPRGSAGSFGSAAAGWSLGRWEVAGRMHGRSVGRCRVCLGPGIIYPVPSLVPIPTSFAINSSILAGAGLTSSTSGASGRAPVSWRCPRQGHRAAGPAVCRCGEPVPHPQQPQTQNLPVLASPNPASLRMDPQSEFFSQQEAPSLCNGEQSCPQ